MNWKGIPRAASGVWTYRHIREGGVQWGTLAIVGEEVEQAGKLHMPLNKE